MAVPHLQRCRLRRSLVSPQSRSMGRTSRRVLVGSPLRDDLRQTANGRSFHRPGRLALQLEPGMPALAKRLGRLAGPCEPLRSPHKFQQETRCSQDPADPMPLGHPEPVRRLAHAQRSQSSPARRSSRGCRQRLRDLRLEMPAPAHGRRLPASGPPARRAPPLEVGRSVTDLLLRPTPRARSSEGLGLRTAPARSALLACRSQMPAAAASSSLVSIGMGPWAHRGLAERCVSPPFSDSLDRRTVAWPVPSLSGRQAEPLIRPDPPTQSATHTTIPAVVAR